MMAVAPITPQIGVLGVITTPRVGVVVVMMAVTNR
jgi:hypothetical protein